jgi:hypothetical protein
MRQRANRARFRRSLPVLYSLALSLCCRSLSRRSKRTLLIARRSVQKRCINRWRPTYCPSYLKDRASQIRGPVVSLSSAHVNSRTPLERDTKSLAKAQVISSSPKCLRRGIKTEGACCCLGRSATIFDPRGVEPLQLLRPPTKKSSCSPLPLRFMRPNRRPQQFSAIKFQVSSLTQIAPGLAAVCIRAAVFTVSPQTSY